MRSILIDAGPLIALFAVDDKHHARYDAMVTEWSATGLRLVTTWPCVVEATHLLALPWRLELLEWVQAGGVQVYPVAPADLEAIIPMMRRYSERHKREMDLADATLLWLASEARISDVMTIDVNDFSRYRLPDGKRLELY